MAHYHAAISIDIDDTKSHENSKRDEFRLNNNNAFALSDLTNDTDVSPCALKKAHIKESIACYEEALRLQRMSRDLKVNIGEKKNNNILEHFSNSYNCKCFIPQNKVSLTKILKESNMKAMVESKCIDEEMKTNNFNEDDTFDMIDVTVTPSSKFILSLTDPDFTAYKVFTFRSLIDLQKGRRRESIIISPTNFIDHLCLENSKIYRLMILLKNWDRWPYFLQNDIGLCHGVFA